MTELVPIAEKPLPVTAAPPAVCTPTNDGVHLLTVDASGRRTLHFVVDGSADAEVVGELPMLPAAVAATDRGLLVTGSGREGEPIWALLGAGGGIDEWGRVPCEGELLLWPQQLQGAPRLQLVWATDPAELRVWTWDLGDSPTVALRCQTPTFELCAAAVPAGVAIARVGGATSDLELLGTTADAATRVDVPDPLCPQLLADDDGLLLLALSYRGTVELRRYDELLREVGDAIRLEPAAPASPRAGLLARGDRRTAAGYQVATPSLDGPERITARFRVLEAGKEPSAPLEIEPAGGFHAAAWLDDTLVLIHGDNAAIVSTFAVS